MQVSLDATTPSLIPPISDLSILLSSLSVPLRTHNNEFTITSNLTTHIPFIGTMVPMEICLDYATTPNVSNVIYLKYESDDYPELYFVNASQPNKCFWTYPLRMDRNKGDKIVVKVLGDGG